MAAATTATQMIVAVGQIVQWNVGGVAVQVIVCDVKTAWGKNRLLIEPKAGHGRVWVELSSVSLPAAAAFQCAVCRGGIEVNGACWECGDVR